MNAWRATILNLESGEVVRPRQLDALIERRARALRSLGISSGSRVALSKFDPIEFFVDLGALWKLNAVVVILDSYQKPPETARSLKIVEPDFVLSPSGDSLYSSPEPSPRTALHSDAAIVLFTSGSSAIPKAVIHTHAGLKSRIGSIGTAVPPDDRTTTLNLLPLHFGHGLIGNCLSMLSLEGVLALAPRLTIHNAHLVQHWIDSTQTTFLSGTPSIWKLILSLNDRPSQKLRRAQCASASGHLSLFRSIASWTDAPLWNVYGLTECASWVSDHQFQKAGDEHLVGDGRLWQTEFVVPKINGDTSPRLLSIQTDGIFSNYWGKSAADSGLTGNCLLTEDLCDIDSSGAVRLHGRQSRLINRGGLKVSPEEVEAVLAEHPDITDVVVTARPSASNQQAGDFDSVGAVVASQVPLTPVELRSYLAARVSDFKIPLHWKFVSSIPRTTSGKLNWSEIEKVWHSSKA